MAERKKKPKPIQFQMGWPGLIAVVVSTVCVLLWTFVLGFWMGQKVFTGAGSSKTSETVLNPRKHAPGQSAGPAESAGVVVSGHESSLFDQNERAIEDLKNNLKQEGSQKEGDSIPTEVITPSEKDQQVKKKTAEKKEKSSAETKKAGKNVQKGGAGLKVEKVSQVKREGLKHFFSLQIASCRKEGQARTEAKRWKKKGYYAQVKKADLGRKGVWYRVLLGRYKSLETAKKAASRLASKEGVRSYVVKGSK